MRKTWHKDVSGDVQFVFKPLLDGRILQRLLHHARLAASLRHPGPDPGVRAEVGEARPHRHAASRWPTSRRRCRASWACGHRLPAKAGRCRWRPLSVLSHRFPGTLPLRGAVRRGRRCAVRVAAGDRPAGRSYCDGSRCARTPLRLIGPGSRRRTHCARWGELRSNSRGESDHEARCARRPPGQAGALPDCAPPPACPRLCCKRRWRQPPNARPGGLSRRQCPAGAICDGCVLAGSARLRASSSDSPWLSERSSPSASAASSATRPPGQAAQR